MNPFAALGIEPEYGLDLRAVEKRHRELSRALHPDKFASSGATERRMALTKAVEVNEAWRTVRDPIRRAESLFRLRGVEVGEMSEPQSSPAFLLEVMEQREALAEARDAKDVDRVRVLMGEIDRRATDVERCLAEGFARGRPDPSTLAGLVPKLSELRFLRRFLEEAGAMVDDLSG